MIPCFVHSSKKFPGYTSEVCLQPLNQPRPRRIGAQLFTHLSRAARFCLQNLSTHGVHEVSQRRFVLVSADHPIVSAISVHHPLDKHYTLVLRSLVHEPNPLVLSRASQENADKLQMGEYVLPLFDLH